MKRSKGRNSTGADPIEGFPTEIGGLPEATTPEVVELADGDAFDLRIGPVAKQLGEATVRMLAYNGSIPGPTLTVPQGSHVTINVANDGDLEATVHWHGLRLDNRYDGTHETQAPIPIGGSFGYRLEFPDPGVYWYHPHIREDYGQELGLYGNILVVPAEADYWPPVNREIALTLDDVLIEDGKIAAFSRSEPSYVAMGRFGNVMLVGGEPKLSLNAQLGEVVRLYLTNTANTRVFAAGLKGARMKLVGGDSGRVERQVFVDEVLLAPSERAVVDVLFEKSGEVLLEHRTPERIYPLALITVSEDRAEPSLVEQFERLRTSPELVAERQRLERYLAAAPDKTLAFVAEMDLGTPEGAVVYACPMHPDVVSDEPGSCPRCGMKLLAVATTYTCPMHPDVVSEQPDRCPKCGMKLLPSQLVGQAPDHRDHGEHGHAHHGDGHGQNVGGHGQEQASHGHEATHTDSGESHGHHGGDHEHDHHEKAHAHGERQANEHGAAHAHAAGGSIEWEDDMVEVNRLTTPATMRWKIVDRTTGAENHAIAWSFQVGDRVKLRLVNEMDSDHPMHHPFHIHGAGRFLILRRDDRAESNLAWKDTVLVRTGETVDILLDVTNPGVWMAHCHIAEHHEGGMMFSFDVTERAAGPEEGEDS